MNWDYVAGFWDGEGCIRIATSGTDTGNRWSYIYIMACQATPQDACLKEIQAFLYGQGVASRIYIAKSNGPRRQPISKLMVTGNRVNKMKFLTRLKDRCIVKRPQLLKAIAHIAQLKYYSTQYDPTEKLRRCKLAYAIYRRGQSRRKAARANNITDSTLVKFIRQNKLPLRTMSDSMKLSWGKRHDADPLLRN